MNKRISNYFIFKLLNSLNIVDVISSRLNLKKSGNNYKSLCPFHIENNPSFTVSSDKQLYYCFGCNKGGNLIDFIINYEKKSFLEVIYEISNLLSLNVEYENYCYKNNFKSYDDYYILLNKFNEICISNLFKKSNISVLNYLNSRGIVNETLKIYSIGYCDFNFDFFKYFSCLEIEKLKKINIFFCKNKLIYINNIFKNRIIFPIKNIFGKIVGFGARSLFFSNVKYLNSPDSEIFLKKKHLYGLYEIKDYKDLNRILIVEGYMDVLTLSQYGIKYAVSTLGVNISFFQIKLLYKFTDNIIFCYDGDFKYKKSYFNFLKSIFPYLLYNKKISFVSLPDNYDPDSLIKKIGKNAFENMIDKCIPLSEFLFSNLVLDNKINNFYEKIKYYYLISSLIDLIPDVYLRIFLNNKLKYIIGIFSNCSLKKILFNENFRFVDKVILSNEYKYIKIRILIGLLIQNPWLYSCVVYNNLYYLLYYPGVKLFKYLVYFCKKTNILNTSCILENFRNSNLCFNYLVYLSNKDFLISKNNIRNVFMDYLFSLYKVILENEQNELIIKFKNNKMDFLEKKKLLLLNRFLIEKRIR